MDLNGIRDFHGLRNFQQTMVTRGIAQGAVSGQTVMVKFAGAVIKCRTLRSVTTAAGDIVLCARLGLELVVVEKMFDAPRGTDPSDPGSSFPPNPWKSVQTGKSTFRPIETRSYRDSLGWRKDTDDTLQGDWGGNNHKGCAFYGNGPSSLGGAEVLNAWVKVKRQSGSSWSTHEATTLKRFPEKKRPSGDTDVSFIGGTATGPRLSQGESEDFQLPDSWGQELVDGTAGGLAIHTNTNDPKARLEGRGSWSPAWTLIIEWRRVI